MPQGAVQALPRTVMPQGAVQALPRTVMPQGAAPGEHVRSPDKSCADGDLAVGFHAAGGRMGRHGGTAARR